MAALTYARSLARHTVANGKWNDLLMRIREPDKIERVFACVRVARTTRMCASIVH